MLEKVLSDYYEHKIVSMTSINKKDFHNDIREMIVRCLTHVKHVVGKSVENETIEDMPNNNLRHIHEMHQSLTRDKIIHITKECRMLKKTLAQTQIRVVLLKQMFLIASH